MKINPKKTASCYDPYKKLPTTCTEGVERNTKKPVGVSTRPGAEPPPWGIHPQAYDSTRARARPPPEHAAIITSDSVHTLIGYHS